MASNSGGNPTNALDNLMMAYTDLSSTGKGSSFKGPALKDVQPTRAAAPAYKPSQKARDWSSFSQNLESAFSTTTGQAAATTSLPFTPMFQTMPQSPLQPGHIQQATFPPNVQQQQAVYQTTVQQQPRFQADVQQQQPVFHRPVQQQQQPRFQPTVQQQDDWGDFKSSVLPAPVAASPVSQTPTPIFQTPAPVKPAVVVAAPHQHIFNSLPPTTVATPSNDDDFSDFISAKPTVAAAVALTTSSNIKIKPEPVKTTKYPKSLTTSTTPRRKESPNLGTFGDFASPTEPSKTAFNDPALFPPPKRASDYSLHAPPKQTIVHVKENPINAFTADFPSAPVAVSTVGVMKPVAMPNSSDKYGAFRSLFTDESTVQETPTVLPMAVPLTEEEDDFGDFASPVPAVTALNPSVKPIIPATKSAPKPVIPSLPSSKPKTKVKLPIQSAAFDLFTSCPPPTSGKPSALTPKADLLNEDLLSQPPPVMENAVDLLATMSLAPQSLPPLSIPEPVKATTESPTKKQQYFFPVAKLGGADVIGGASVVPWLSDTPPPPPDRLGVEDEDDELAEGISNIHMIGVESPPVKVAKPVFVPKIVQPAVVEEEKKKNEELEDKEVSLNQVIEMNLSDDGIPTRKSSGSSLNLPDTMTPAATPTETTPEKKKTDDSLSLSGEDEILLADWLSALVEVEKLLSSANAKFSSIQDDEDTLDEVLGTVETRDYLRNLSEVYRVALRIKVACENRHLGVTNLPERVEAVTDMWLQLMRLTGTPLPAIRPPSHLRSGDDSRSNCGVCQLDVDMGVAITGEDDNDIINAAVLHYGPKRYHASCANMWVNLVRPMLPSLL